MEIIVEGFGKSIHKKDNRILIKKEDEIISDDPVTDIESIILFAKGSITFDALNLLAQHNKKIVSISANGQINYIVNNLEDQSNITLLRKQLQVSQSEKSIEISKEIIKSKITNQRSTITTLNRRIENKNIKNSQKLLKNNIKQLEKENINKQNILGIEGQSSVIYWNSIKEILPSEYNFKERNKRPAHDIVNAMLNYGYAILASQITLSIVKSGLNPYIGILHSDLNNRTSLTFDVIEEFRQQIVDKSIFTLINNKQIKPYDFTEDEKISLDKRRLIIEKIFNKLNSQIQYKNNYLTYDEIIDAQIKQLKNSILDDSKYFGFSLRG